MRFLYTTAAVCALAAGAIAAEGDHAADKAAIQALHDGFAAAWAKNDAKAMAAIWAEDGDLINPFGRVATGRAEVEQLFTDEHTSFAKGTTWSYAKLQTKFVTDDVAVATSEAMVDGAQGPDGLPMDIASHVLTNVLTKKDGKWWVAAARVAFPAPPPGAPPAAAGETK